MALQIRRGTDAERLLITPLEGELIYTTDTRRLYVGDGTTVGGIAVDTNTGGGGGSSALNDLTDVTITSVSTGQVLKWNGTAWTNQADNTGTTISSINDINDVVITSPTLGQVLKYNGTAWVNGTDLNDGTGSLAIQDLTNVSITSPTNGQVLKFNGTAWVNGTDEAGSSSVALNDVTDVTITSPTSGQVLKFNGTNWINDVDNSIVEGSSYNISVTSNNDDLLVDSISGAVNAVGGLITSSITTPGTDLTIDSNTIFNQLSATNINSDLVNSSSILSNFVEINQDENNTVGFLIRRSSNITTNHPSMTFIGSRGSNASPTAPASGDILSSINFRSFDGSSFITPASISVTVAGTVSAGRVPTSITLISTRATGGDGTPEEVGLFDGNGVFQLRRGRPISSFVINNAYDSGSGGMNIVRSRNTIFSPTPSINEDIIGHIQFSTRTTTTPEVFPTKSAEIRGIVDGPVSTNIGPGRLEFLCQNTGGVVDVRMVLKNDGRLQVNAIESLPSGSLTINAASATLSSFLRLPVYANDTARNTAIPTPTAGMVVFMTSGTTPAATNQPQYYNGTSWVNM